MIFPALDRTRRGVVARVFDTTDRVQHMFFAQKDGTGNTQASSNASIAAPTNWWAGQLPTSTPKRRCSRCPITLHVLSTRRGTEGLAAAEWLPGAERGRDWREFMP